MNELKKKLDKNIIDFVLWNSDKKKPNEIEMYEYLNNLKGFLNKNNKSSKKTNISKSKKNIIIESEFEFEIEKTTSMKERV